ncbi:MAG: 4-hydroxy-3-methylbut-2-enyl diphosphate reductase [Phycisphaeraceae bacterium]|nr:4-hydroxy-3-methylbut-2-enyl diphosphate reductase [Phycisphaeraceae bacterium]MCW5763170.1 4-hydroxy-3-methylbut-2-enyl diphosphate reductase [Phycisphaeraceae bacterium]
MRLILANPRGFCAGVRMAIDVVDQVLDVFAGQRVYVYHEIVHNRHVVGRFVERGVVFVESIDEVPEGSVVVFSAHGVSPLVRAAAAARNLTAIDATCPLVTKVHSEAIRYARQGYQILLVGHRDHQEVVGTSGEAPGAIQVVESPACIATLKIDDPEKLVYLTQTTLSTDDAGVIIDALKRAFPAIKAPPSEDICYATTNRQQAVRVLAPHADLVLVVGSSNSSNSVRLTEIARNVGTRARLLDDASQLDEAWFDDHIQTVLLTAGASAPEDLVAEICRWIVQRYGATIHLGDVTEESVEFGLPGNLKRVMRERGIDPESRRIRVEAPRIIEAVYGASAVELTISARG